MINGIFIVFVSFFGGVVFVEIGVFFVIGVVVGVLYVWASDFMVRKKFDDVVDVVVVYFFGGIWGIVVFVFFSVLKFFKYFYGDFYKGCGLLYGCSYGGVVFGVVLVFLFVLCVWVFVMVLVVFVVFKYFNVF